MYVGADCGDNASMHKKLLHQVFEAVVVLLALSIINSEV